MFVVSLSISMYLLLLNLYALQLCYVYLSHNVLTFFSLLLSICLLYLYVYLPICLLYLTIYFSTSPCRIITIFCLYGGGLKRKGTRVGPTMILFRFFKIEVKNVFAKSPCIWESSSIRLQVQSM